MTLLDAARSFPSVFDGAVATDATTPAVAETADPMVAEAAVTAAAPVGFAELGVPEALVRALHRDKITTPFAIQAATIPDALAGRDVLGRGQTGSGKTLAFGLPMLVRIAASGRSKPRRPKALVLVPTRELAMQVNDALTPLARSLGLFTKTAFDTRGMEPVSVLAAYPAIFLSQHSHITRTLCLLNAFFTRDNLPCSALKQNRSPKQNEQGHTE